MPKWAQAIVKSARPLVGNPSTSHHTHFQKEGSCLLSHAICDDPQTFSKVIGHSKWDNAMEEEYSSLMKNHTWDLCPLPKGRKLVRCKWIYRTKYTADGSINKHKAHLVMKGFS